MKKRHGTHVILGAITPDQDLIDADMLTYPNLRATLKSENLPSFLKRSGLELLQKRLDFSPASAQEELRSVYLLSAAYRLQKAWTMPEKFFWSAQFTTTSVKLFGRPLSREVASIAAEELEYFNKAVDEYGIDPEFADPVISAYKSLINKRTKPRPSLEKRYASVLEDLHRFFMHEYGECFTCFDKFSPGALLTSQDLAECFTIALNTMKSRDAAWEGWAVVHNKGAKLAVDVGRKRIVIGNRRTSMTVAEAKGLLAHEILVHAQRAVQGAKRSYDLSIGLPDYLIAEEGLGALIESAINGSIPLKIKDRYIDIALALGAWRRRPLLRNQMYIFCYSRAVIRSVVNNETVDLDELERVTWEHVNRIYRGGLGNKYLAVFTKDIAYYQGFIKMARYLQNASRRGRLTDSLAYVYRGKFDPTNPAHRQIVAQSKPDSRGSVG